MSPQGGKREGKDRASSLDLIRALVSSLGPHCHQNIIISQRSRVQTSLWVLRLLHRNLVEGGEHDSVHSSVTLCFDFPLTHGLGCVPYNHSTDFC